MSLNICYAHCQNEQVDMKVSKLSKFTNKWSPKHILIDTWVFEKGRARKFGHLYGVNDSSIILIPQIEMRKEKRDLMIINYSEINKIALREDNRKSRVFRKSLLYATLAGLIVGGVYYVIDGRSNIHTFGLGFVSGAGISLFTGIVVGSLKVVIPINRNYQNFDKYKNELRSISAKP